jgi:hypothetical protein
MKKTTFKGITSRLEWLKTCYYAIQVYNLTATAVPSRGEMKYIKLVINELQELGYRYDLHCMERDLAHDEQKGLLKASQIRAEKRKTVARLKDKWQRK